MKPQKLTIKQIIEAQEFPNNQNLYLLQQGLFYHAFNQSAVFFYGITSYKVRRVKCGNENVEQLGIPCTVIDGVLHRLKELYPEVVIDGLFYEPHYVIVLPLSVMQNIPYEPFTDDAGEEPTHTDVKDTVCDIVLSLNADTTHYKQLRRTVKHLQRLLLSKA